MDTILGYPANIRLLRSLIETDKGMSASALAERTGLSVPGVHKVISRLIKTGIIKHEGSGRTQLIVLRHEHPMSGILMELFKAEKNNFETLIKEIKAGISELDIKPKSVWIYGKVAKRIDDYGDPLQIAIQDEAKKIDDITEKFKDQISKAGIEKKFDVTIEVRGVTSGEVESIMNPCKIMLWGFDPFYLYGGKNAEKGDFSSHQDLDNRALNDAGMWIIFLQIHPEVIERTKSYLQEKIQSESSGVKNELKEWYRLLEGISFQRLKKFMQSDSERSIRMRQSLPFWPVLNEAEREEFKSLAEKVNE